MLIYFVDKFKSLVRWEKKSILWHQIRFKDLKPQSSKLIKNNKKKYSNDDNQLKSENMPTYIWNVDEFCVQTDVINF